MRRARIGTQAALVATALSVAVAGCRHKPPAPPPLATCADSSRLVCTGLYGPASGAAAKRIAPGIEAYAPGFLLWSDGLEKRRYIYLPPGTRIDTRDMDEWSFPIGTRLWKEFRWNGKRIETRLLEKTGAASWRLATFVWNADDSDAREAKAGRTVTLGGGHGPYDIPGPDDCSRCHSGRRDNVLGFEALALATPDATGLTLTRLEAEGRLTRVPTAAETTVPGTALDRRALGWLHMNCGVSCHNPNPSAGASFTGLYLKLLASGATTLAQTPAVRTALGRLTTALGYRVPNAPKVRLVPGHPHDSAIYVRAASRTPTLAMPPLATHLVDRAAVALLERWISTLAPAAGRTGEPDPRDRPPGRGPSARPL